MKRVELFAAFCLVAICLPVTAESLRFEGLAYDLQSGESIYSEAHRIELDDQGRYLYGEVLYRQAKKSENSTALIARKNLYFGDSSVLPDLIFEDLRYSGQTHLSRDKDNVLIESRTEQGLERESISLDEQSLVVADAGFDRMIQQQWDKLAAGDKVEFEFVALTRAKLVSFEIFMEQNEQGMLRFRVQPQNWLVRMLVEPLILHYDSDKRRLRRFEGLTNIPKYSGADHYEARIEYRYFDEQNLASAQP